MALGVESSLLEDVSREIIMCIFSTVFRTIGLQVCFWLVMKQAIASFLRQKFFQFIMVTLYIIPKISQIKKE